MALISEEKYEEALEKARDIQYCEPSNKMIKDYIVTIKELVMKQRKSYNIILVLVTIVSCYLFTNCYVCYLLSVLLTK